MSELCIFAGTTEGRQLAELLVGQPVRVLACVATDYGETLIPEAENVEVSAVKTLDLGFENSDHNPVLLTVSLKT